MLIAVIFAKMLPSLRLELNGHRRRLTWEATPRSIHEGVASAILNSDCLVFDTSIAQLFAENGNLGINVTISMVSLQLKINMLRFVCMRGMHVCHAYRMSF
jgi:hypothetical protein